MNTYPHPSSSIPMTSAQKLVALTVVVYRWQRDYLLALAGEQGCSPSTVLRALLDQGLGPPPEEAAPAKRDQPLQDEADEPAMDRDIRLPARHRQVLAAVADRRAVSVAALLGAIVDAWLQANTDTCD